MIVYIVVAIAVLPVIVLGIFAASKSSSIQTTEEQGPMPKRHGGFNQTVHGGKS